MAKRTAASKCSDLLFSENELIDTYVDIPYFMRRHLKQRLDSLSWQNAMVAACNGQSEQSMELYKRTLLEMDKFIDREGGLATDYAVLMTFDKCTIVNKFQSDPVGFVRAMLHCMNKEEDINFLREGEMTSPDSNTESPQSTAMEAESSPDEIEMTLVEIEQLVKTTRENIKLFDQLSSSEGNAELYQESIRSISDDDESSGRWNLTTLRSHHSENERKRLEKQTAFEESISGLDTVTTLCEGFIEILILEINRWRKAQALSCVHLGPEDCFDLAARQRITRFADALSTLSAWLEPASPPCHQEAGLVGNLRQVEQQDGQIDGIVRPTRIGAAQLKLKLVEKKYFENMVIVSKQPKEIVGVENKNTEKRGKKSSAENSTSADASNTDDKETKGKIFTSKKCQAFDTRISIPGGEKFPSLQILNKHIECVTDADLATAVSRGTSIADAPVTEGSNLTWKDKTDQNAFRCDVEFNTISLSYKRPKTSMVYEGFFRLRYIIKVAVNSSEYTIQVLSLPIHFNTGSLQLLDLTGARMWYIFSSPDNNMYSGDFKLRTTQPVEDVIKMLDLRLRHLDKNARHLREEEKDFLMEQLPVDKGSVSLNDFLKKEPWNENAKAHVRSFYSWFHAVANTIKTLCLRPWSDGAFYGLISDERSEHLLSGPKIPLGTLLLRFSRRYVEKTSSPTPLVAIVMAVKMRCRDTSAGNLDTVEQIPLKPDLITKAGLYGAVASIEHEGTAVAINLFGYEKRGKVAVLQNYNEKKAAFKDYGYRIMLEDIAKMNLSLLSATSSSQQSQSLEQRKKKNGSSGWKKPCKKSPSTSSSSPSYSQSLPSSQSSPREVLPNFEEGSVSPAEYKPDPHDILAQSHMGYDGQGQIADTFMDAQCDESNNLRPLPQPIQQLQTFGSSTIAVDTTQISLEFQRQLSSETSFVPLKQCSPITEISNAPVSNFSSPVFVPSVSLTGMSQLSANGSPQAMYPNVDPHLISSNNISQVMSPTSNVQAMSPTGVSPTMYSQDFTHLAPKISTESTLTGNTSFFPGVIYTMPQNEIYQTVPDSTTFNSGPITTVPVLNSEVIVVQQINGRSHPGSPEAFIPPNCTAGANQSFNIPSVVCDVVNSEGPPGNLRQSPSFKRPSTSGGNQQVQIVSQKHSQSQRNINNSTYKPFGKEAILQTPQMQSSHQMNNNGTAPSGNIATCEFELNKLNSQEEQFLLNILEKVPKDLLIENVATVTSNQ